VVGASLLVALFALCFASATSAAAPDVRIVATDPALPAELGRAEALYLRLSYRSDAPLRFQASGFAAGSEVKVGERMNPAPLHPAGEGEARVWAGYGEPARLDQIRVTVMDEKWRVVQVLALPVAASWSAVPAEARTRAEWVARLGAAEEALFAGPASAPGAGLLGSLSMALLTIGVPGYFVLQPLFAWRFAGGWRIAALAPLAVMAPAFAHAAYALAAGSNLWPIVVVLSAPFLFLYLCGLAAVRFLARWLAV
jgi:hypothetical protein